jgi:hypothetical protein
MAWLAMMVAMVARPTSGNDGPSRRELEKGIAYQIRCFDQKRCLARVAEQQCGQHKSIPRQPDRATADATHVGVECFAAGDGEENAPEHDEASPAMADKEIYPMARIDSGQDFGTLNKT